MNAQRAAQLLEANEHLLLAVIRAQDEAAAAAQALKEITRCTHLAAMAECSDGVLLFDRFVQGMALARHSGDRLALLSLSIDNFRDITDARGHAVGGEVLTLAARRLSAAVRASDTVCRQGSSDFMILLPAVSDASAAIAVADSLIVALALPDSVAGVPFRLESSIGISVFPDDGEDVDGLIDRATAARYHALRGGLGSFFYRGERPTSARSLELRATEAQDGPPAIQRLEHETAASLGAQQREANEKLLLAGLEAHALLDAAELANRRQLEFMGLVAHELRSPLAPISNAAALLGLAKAPTVLPMVKGVIERQVAHLNRLVGDLLDLTRVTTGKLRLEISRLNMAELVEDAVGDFRAAVAARKQHLDLQLPAVAVTVSGDRFRLTQVVGNLIGNASKYTPEAGTIAVSLEVAGASVVLTVSDNGIGITPEALTHVFEPFVQERHATEFDGSGLGIGLSLVRELVLGHGGRVDAASAGPGFGSRFTVTLPLLRAGD